MINSKVLIVDDEPLIRDTLQAELSRGPYTVTTAENGRAALEAIEKEEFDLIIMDIVMPEMEGIEMLRRLRALRPDVKVIAMSGGGRRNPTAFLNVAQESGADELLGKPFSRMQLRQAMMRLLATSHSSVSTPTAVH